MVGCVSLNPHLNSTEIRWCFSTYWLIHFRGVFKCRTKAFTYTTRNIYSLRFHSQSYKTQLLHVNEFIKEGINLWPLDESFYTLCSAGREVGLSHCRFFFFFYISSSRSSLLEYIQDLDDCRSCDNVTITEQTTLVCMFSKRNSNSIQGQRAFFQRT